MKKNLNKSVIYNIYPTSFYDSDGDGIGDLNGITQKLDYVAEFADMIWINPIFVSPFHDGGYDICDYYAIDHRFGTMGDLDQLIEKAQQLKIKIILDLVVGHTSDHHPWFLKSKKAKKNKYSDYYIWTDDIYSVYPYNLVTGNSERNGSYMLNAFYCQPALNFGFAQKKYPWQFDYRSETCIQIRNEVVKIIEFYLSKGISGFRVDMAGVLVKDDDGTCSAEVWKYIFDKVREHYPDAIFIAEWGQPYKSVINECFDIDFFTHCYNMGYTELFRMEPGSNVLKTNGDSFFRKEGKGVADTFFDYFAMNIKAISNDGYICIPSGNHDLPRISFGRSIEELKIIYAFQFSLPCVPLIYYGDEIGMKYKNIISKDGGFVRTGSRTPMRWNNQKNCGFSKCEAKKLYLPIIEDEKDINVEDELSNSSSLLSTIKTLSHIRKEEPCLGADQPYEVLNGSYPIVIKRNNGNRCLYAFINPSNRKYEIKVRYDKILIENNCEVIEEGMRMAGISYAYLVSESKDLSLIASALAIKEVQ